MFENIRNFCVISHIDHGKSTLADRLLELTGTVEKRKMQEQFLDMMELERERGITIKLQPVRMKYNFQGKEYILNLIDTPGHVDFTYEVSRSLAAVEGAILLVDATQGVQAQTLANLQLAQKSRFVPDKNLDDKSGQGLTIIPVINKIDLPNARIKEVEEEIFNLIGAEDILKISAKTGEGVGKVLEAVVAKIPPAAGEDGKFKALIFDSAFDAYKGVIAYVRVFGGTVKAGSQIRLFAAKEKSEAIEVGYFSPKLEKSREISNGEIGYIATGIKTPGKVRVGDTIMGTEGDIAPLPGYEEPLLVVFASFYPENSEQFDELKDALEKLKLTDASLSFEPESSLALGRGFRLGFLGLLHIEIISERLKREFGLNLIISSPTVEYEVFLKSGSTHSTSSGQAGSPQVSSTGLTTGGSTGLTTGGKVLRIRSAVQLPDPSFTEKIQEPISLLNIISPLSYMGSVMKLVGELRSRYRQTDYLSKEVVRLVYEVPLSEIITDFYDRLKSISSGYASMSYEPFGYREADLVRLDILVSGELVEPFSKVVPREQAERVGRAMVEKLKDVIPPQLFAVSLQAAVGGKILSRETIKARRKDVTGYLYGGDVTRKKKLLEKQKKGKKRMKELGRVNIPQKVFLEMLKK